VRETADSPPEQQHKPAYSPTEYLTSLGVDAETASDWLQLRRAKHAPPTKLAIDGIAREAALAKVSLAAALAECCQRGWTGFKAAWLSASVRDGRARESPEERKRRTNAEAKKILGIDDEVGENMVFSNEKVIEGEAVRCG